MHRCRLLRTFCVHISEGEHVVKAIFAPIVVAATPAIGEQVLQLGEIPQLRTPPLRCCHIGISPPFSLPIPHRPMPTASPASLPYSRSNPFPGKIVVNRSLCGEGSKKDTRHLEIDLTGWGLSYEVGDSLAVCASNDPVLVDEILNAISARGDEPVKSPKRQTTLREALLRDCRITQTTPKFLRMIVARANAAPLLAELVDPERKEDLDRYLWGMEVIDFLSEHPSIKISPQEFVDVLAKLQPRLYSISSSLKAFPNSGPSDRGRGELREPRATAQRRLLHLPGGTSRSCAGARYFPSASKFHLPARREHAHHHGGTWHRDRAVPRLPSGAQGGWGQREELALLRIAAPALQLFLPGGI